jgi:hypothetical protein
MYKVKVTGKAFHILVNECNFKASFGILIKKVIIIMLESYILMYIQKDPSKKVGLEVNSEKVKSFGIALPHYGEES